MYLDKQLTEEQEKYFLEMIKERLNERPIAYIIGNREFMGLDFFVKEGVLIPRPDTETLVEEIINICNNKSELNILDIGTGSGAITISLAKYLNDAHVTSADISDIALEIASKNAVSNDVNKKIDFIKSDIFSNISREEKFDIIVSNPPYIKKPSPKDESFVLPPLFMYENHTPRIVNADYTVFPTKFKKTVPGPCSLHLHGNFHQPFPLYSSNKSYSSCHYLCSIII